jgi:hypothetical protein
MRFCLFVWQMHKSVWQKQTMRYALFKMQIYMRYWKISLRSDTFQLHGSYFPAVFLCFNYQHQNYDQYRYSYPLYTKLFLYVLVMDHPPCLCTYGHSQHNEMRTHANLCRIALASKRQHLCQLIATAHALTASSPDLADFSTGDVRLNSLCVFPAFSL